MPVKESNKKIWKTTSLKGFQTFEVDTATGFPICPLTRKVIDGTVPYCKSCLSFGHSWISFTGCGKHNEWLAQNAMKKKQKEQTEKNNKKLNEEDNNIEE